MASEVVIVRSSSAGVFLGESQKIDVENRMCVLGKAMRCSTTAVRAYAYIGSDMSRIDFNFWYPPVPNIVIFDVVEVIKCISETLPEYKNEPNISQD